MQIHCILSVDQVLMTLAGDPMAIECAGMDFVTTEFAPTILQHPILHPGMITTF
jgi:hypothetical protein